MKRAPRALQAALNQARLRAGARIIALVAVVTGACASPSAVARFPLDEPLVLAGSDGRDHDVRRETANAKLTVFVFFSRTCPCVAVHDPRLRALATEYQARGVQLFVVDSEVGATPAGDALEAKHRAYPFPLLTDPGAKLAKSAGADFATHAIIVDARGAILYSGGIDSDKTHLHEDARPYLRAALDELLAGRTPAATHPEPLGCALELD